MRGSPLLAALLLLGPSARAQAPEGAERPPERPQAEAPAASLPEGETPEAPPPEAGDAPLGEARDAAPPAGPPKRELLREADMDFSACLLALHVMGASWRTGPEITGEQADCGIARPVTLTEALPGLAIDGAPVMRCQTARALGWWLRDHVIPAARHLPGAPRPVALALGTAYQCRGVVGGGADTDLSEHAFGNALDIAAIRLDSGAEVTVSQAGGNDLPAAFLAAIRGAACLYFTTVLGPGSNAAHGDHLHLDIKERRGGYRICQ